MSASDKPVFVFVPGAWHTADTFDVVRQLMLSRGLASEAIALPSVGGPLEKGLHADIEHSKEILREMADAGRQIVVVNHSYGGMVGSGAVEGLGFKQRAEAGLPGGVIMVVWMAAFVTPKGQTVLDQLGGDWLPWMIIKVRAVSPYSPHVVASTDMPFIRTPMTDIAGPPAPRRYSTTTCHQKRSKRQLPSFDHSRRSHSMSLLCTSRGTRCPACSCSAIKIRLFHW